MTKRRTNFHVHISARIPREDSLAMRALRQRGEVPADTLRRIIRAGVDVLKTAENTPEKERVQ